MRKIIILLSLFFLLMQGVEVNAMKFGPEPVPQTLNQETAAYFVDEYMQRQMDALNVPGAAIVLVQNGEVLLEKGYGTADLAQGIPVDAQNTLFRTGSVSKLFTATAVMQLVEQGKIDLDGDVNHYLQSTQLENKFDEPVTVADLLLHTAGFDENYLGAHVRDAGELKTLAEFWQDHLTERYLPPGEFISYNDLGYTLAGILVEDVSGMSFDEYVAAHILTPLQMDSSTFTQPQPENLKERLAIGYRFDGTSYQPYELDYIHVSPSAALVSSVSDIGHFVSAHLNDGQFEGTSILKPETVAAMQQTQFAHHPELRGRGYGFSEWLENGHRGVFHDGGNPGFLNRLFLLPEEGVGFYLVFNSDQHGKAARFHREFTSQFFDTFYPEVEETAVTPTAMPLNRSINDFTGYYRDVPAYSHDTLQKLTSIMNQFPVAAEGESLAAFGRDYVSVAPLVFKSPTEESTIVFREEADGDISHLFIGTGAYAKVPWYEAQPVQLGFVVWFLVIFVGMIIGGLVWRSAPNLFRGSLVIVGLLNVIFLIGMAVALMQMDRWQFTYGPPSSVVLLLVLPLITLVLAIVIAGFTLMGWRSGDWSWAARIYASVVSLTILFFPLFLNFWNLLGFRY